MKRNKNKISPFFSYSHLLPRYFFLLQLSGSPLLSFSLFRCSSFTLSLCLSSPLTLSFSLFRHPQFLTHSISTSSSSLSFSFPHSLFPLPLLSLPFSLSSFTVCFHSLFVLPLFLSLPFSLLLSPSISTLYFYPTSFSHSLSLSFPIYVYSLILPPSFSLYLSLYFIHSLLLLNPSTSPFISSDSLSRLKIILW